MALPSRIADRFEIERLAGTGGMGEVYRALDLVTGERVALKVVSRDAAQSGERFAQEARVLAEIHHPAVVRYVAHGSTEEGQPWLAMEWLEGEDLAQRLASTGVTTAETLEIGRRVAGALALAHGRGVIHRDIKPSNIFLVGGDVGRATLVDFGIARRSNATNAVTRAGVVLGTPGYMAPEQARGATDLDARADVFALGCVLFECLTGRPAFVGEHVMALLTKILLEEAPRVSSLRSDIDPRLDALVARMMAKLPADRPANAATVATMIDGLGAASSSPALPLPDDTPAPAALTGGEQRLLTVVMVSMPSEDDANEETARTLAVTPVSSPNAGGAVGTALSAHFELLADGTAITVIADGSASDQATRAARYALAVRAQRPETMIVVATGRGVVAGQLPLGEVAERAAAMLEVAGEPAVRLDDVTAGLLDDRFVVQREHDQFVLRDARDEASTSGRTLLGRPCPLVGRERELDGLRSRYDVCVDDSSARATLVLSPPGGGKSRLLREFLRELEAHERPPLILIARGDPMSAGSPFGMAAAALRRHIGVPDGASPEVRAAHLRDRLASLFTGADLERVAEFLGEMSGVPTPGEGSAQLRAARRDAILMGDQIRIAFEDWLSREVTRHPLVLVLEDLHWGDLPTIKLVDGALRNLAKRPFMVVATARPEVEEHFPGLWATRLLDVVRLGPLSRRAVERLVRHALAGAADEATIALVVDRAEGNPFYVEELVRAVAGGRRDELPGTVLAMLQARIGALEPEARRLLRAASIFGQVFWLSGVAMLLADEARTSELDRWSELLVEREITLRSTTARFAEHDEYAFRHGLVRDAAYAMLTEHDLRLGHRLAGAWLERAGETDALVLAEHSERGGEKARAVGWYRRAAAQALEGNDFSAAIVRCERGHACGATGEDAGALSTLEAEAALWMGDATRAAQAGRRAMDTVAVGSELWCAAAVHVANAAGRLGDHAVIEGVADALLTLSDANDARRDDARRAAALGACSLQLYLAGRAPRADALMAKLDAMDPVVHDDPVVLVAASGARMTRAIFRADYEQLSRLGREMSARCVALGNLRASAHALGNSAAGFLELGATDEAAADARSALDIAERLGLSGVRAIAMQALGLTLARKGDLAAGRELEESAVAMFAEQRDRRREARARIFLAMICLDANDVDAAAAAAQASVDLTRAVPPARAPALAVLARVRLAQGTIDEALKLATEASSLSGGASGADLLPALVHAEALHAAGRIEEARTAIAAARARLEQQAQRISDGTLRESLLHAVPQNARILALAREWLGA